jgi:hypothetical protein
MPYCKRGMLFQLLKSKDTSEDGSVMSIGDKDISVVSGDSVPKSMQL